MHTVLQERESTHTEPQTQVPRGVLIVAITLLLGFAIVVVVIAKKWPFTEQAVTRALQDESGSAVHIDHFRQFYFPHPGCVAEGVSLRRSSSEPAFITVQKLTIIGSYPGLLAGRISTLRADGFRVIIVKGAENPNGAGWMPRSLNTTSGVTVGELIADGSAVEFPAEQPGKAPVVFKVTKLKLHDVADNRPLSFQATVELPKPAAEVNVTAKFGPWQSGQAGQTPLSGTYTLSRLDLGEFHGVAGELGSQGNFDGPLEHIKMHGNIDIPDFEVRQSNHSMHMVSQYEATVNGVNGDVSLDAVRVHFGKTTVIGAGSVAHQGTEKGKGKTATFELSSKQARIEDLLWMFVSNQKPDMTGAIVFRGKAVLPPEHRPFLQRLALEGDFGISDAQYPHPQTQRDVDVLSARARGEADKVEDAQEKPGGANYDPGRVLSNVKGHVVLREGIANLRDVSFDVPGASAQVSGTYSLLSKRVDLHGPMHLQAQLSKATTGVKSILLKAIQPFMRKSKSRDSVVEVHMGGTFEHPTYQAFPVAKK